MSAWTKTAPTWGARTSPSRAFGGYDTLCLVGCVLATAALAAGPLGRNVWLADVLNLFRPYAALATLLLLGACLLGRRPALVLAAAALTLGEAALLAAPVLRQDVLGHAQGRGPTLKVVTFNCLVSNKSPSAFVAWVRAAKPDILALEEQPASWEPDLAGLHDVLPYRAGRLHGPVDVSTILSRYPVTEADAFRPARDIRRFIHAEVLVGGRRLQVYALHPNTLRNRGEWRDRNAALVFAAQWIRDSRRPDQTIVLGDWNTPPWSPWFRTFLRIADVKVADPVVWPPMTRVLAAPWGVRLGSSIDHIAASEGVSVAGCRTGPQLGSDHAPQICRLSLTPG